jgi:hypothetical protein
MAKSGSPLLSVANADEQERARRLDLPPDVGEEQLAVVEPVLLTIVDELDEISFSTAGRSIFNRPHRKSDERIISQTVRCEPCEEISTSYGERKYRSFLREKLK